MTKTLLRDKINRGEFFAAPGIHDMIAAVIAKKIGFEIVYGSGYWLTASAHGLPDAGIATYTQMVDRMDTLKRTVGAALIADADTGYGGLLNVHHTVRGYEEVGVSGIQIEDQEFPKKCGHTPFKRIIPQDDMVDKIRVACEARRDPQNTLIIARTDARDSEGLDGALRRATAYGDAGADIIFVEALTSEQEMRTACRAIDKPMIANMAYGGKTPMLSAERLQELGYACAIFPATTALAAAAAIEKSLTLLKETGANPAREMPFFDFMEFCCLIGFEEIWEFERKWGRP
ncbi:MAG TPA: isocitrate lyase/PEP mutase family protein [Alphaproteobacteria bacterium]|nr:isocitrate lyase/PEP mutase family protein [Alphaproteobacteria bacterium]